MSLMSQDSDESMYDDIDAVISAREASDKDKL